MVRSLLVVLALVLGLGPGAAVAGGAAHKAAAGRVEAPAQGAGGMARPRAGKPKGSLGARLGAKLGLARVAQAAHAADGKAPRFRMTHERVVTEIGGEVGAVDVGVTVSQLEKVRTLGGPELVHVVTPDGSTNLELILGRIPLFGGQFLELQGPAINRGGDGRLGFRIAGLGVTGDLDEVGSHKAASYTAEVKLTERGVGRLAARFAPEGVRGAAALIGGAVGDVLAAAVPGVSVLFAAHSIRHAWKTFRDPTQDRRHRLLAGAHAVADTVRIALPMVGAAANLALVVGNAVFEQVQARQRAKALAARATSGAPPPGEAPALP